MTEKLSEKPRFSIVIPTYNAELLLYDCLEALCDQATPQSSFEIIVVNDGGNKEISENITSLKCRVPIKYFYQTNSGPAAARNLGIARAKGDVVIFLDDDSLPTPTWLNATMAAWDTYSNLDGIGGYIKKDSRDTIYCRVNADFFNWYLNYYSKNGRQPFLATCNASYKKDILRKVGNFDEKFKKPAGEDRDLNIKISQLGGRLKLDDSILVYHDRDLTLIKFAKKYYNYGKFAKTIYSRYPHHNRISKKDYFDLFASILKEYKSIREKLSVFFLITLSQLSTIIGYYSTVIRKMSMQVLQSD